jgi:hypothetical protein
MADQIRAIVRALEGVAERVITRLALDVTANLVETTPVDTGWARSNWVPAIGVPFLADIAPGRATEQMVAGGVGRQQSAIVTVAATYRLGRGSVFVSNNVPYITDLNNGTSRKAPAGFVQMAIAKAVAQAARGPTT